MNMSKNEQSNYRQQLAAEIKSVPKKQRRTILDKAQENQQYWQARGEKIKQTQEEAQTDDGMAVFLKKKTLYHGSGTKDIKLFDKAEEDTVGSGVYFTSEPKDAIGYARRRSKSNADKTPVIYEGSVENMKVLDLRNKKNVNQILDGFKQVLLKEIERNKENDSENKKFFWRRVLETSVEKIDSDEIGTGNLREVTFSTGRLFSDYCKSLGYEGLITFEGGEGQDVGSHDTYLIFDPGRVKINREHKIV